MAAFAIGVPAASCTVPDKFPVKPPAANVGVATERMKVNTKLRITKERAAAKSRVRDARESIIKERPSIKLD
jgi:hypothetical protein